MDSGIELDEIASKYLPAPVPYAVITPPGDPERSGLPLCIVLMGGGGSRESLVDTGPLFDRWWADGSLPPMVLATPSAGMSYYVDDPTQATDWGRFLSDAFVDRLRATCRIGADRASTAILGMSMGGYGALKTAFAYPDRFGFVAAVNPMLEPGFRDAEVGARNRIHHGAGGPSRLIGPGRDPALFESNNPAGRARTNASVLREGRLAIYLEVGDADVVNAHDGTEFLHRVLWDLDVSHEYRLTRGGDHGGPTLIPRMRAAFSWLGASMAEARAAAEARPDPGDVAVGEWIRNGCSGPPPVVAPSSAAFARLLRAQLQPARDRAAASDRTTDRRFGVLPAAR